MAEDKNPEVTNEEDKGKDESIVITVICLLYTNWEVGGFKFANNKLLIDKQEDFDRFTTLFDSLPEHVQQNIVVTGQRGDETPVHVKLNEINAERRAASEAAQAAGGITQLKQSDKTKANATAVPASLLNPTTDPSTIRGGSSTADTPAGTQLPGKP